MAKTIKGEGGKTYKVKNNKPFYKRAWFWIVVVLIIVIGATMSGSGESKSTTTKTSTSQKASVSAERVPSEYRSALSKAKTYANTMNMSKKGVYNQLTSEAGEKFSEKAAQYAVDNVKTDWNKNALAKAKTYQDTMSMSPEGIRDQLTSDSGEKFTTEQADYAINNLDK